MALSDRQDKQDHQNALQQSRSKAERRGREKGGRNTAACLPMSGCFASNNLRGVCIGDESEKMRVQVQGTGSAQLNPTELAR